MWNIEFFIGKDRKVRSWYCWPPGSLLGRAFLISFVLKKRLVLYTNNIPYGTYLPIVLFHLFLSTKINTECWSRWPDDSGSECIISYGTVQFLNEKTSTNFFFFFKCLDQDPHYISMVPYLPNIIVVG
jgi:hypothetical protein